MWLSYARFEAAPLPAALEEEEGGGDEGDEGGRAASHAAAAAGPESDAARAARARAVYERAYRSLRADAPDAKEEAVLLLDAWRAFEAGAEGIPEAERERAVAAVAKKIPKRVKRKRPVTTADGLQARGLLQAASPPRPPARRAAPPPPPRPSLYSASPYNPGHNP